VQTCTLRDLVAEGAAAAIETGPGVARLKSSVDMVKAIEAVDRYVAMTRATQQLVILTSS
jgi:hypothetical protein